MDEYVEEISAINKGHKTIAEALNELEIVKEAFLRSSRIENKINTHEIDICDLKKQTEMLSTYSYVNSKILESQNCTEKIIEAKLDEFYYQFTSEISKKFDELDARKQLDTKVP